MFFESYMSIENIKITRDITLITLLMNQLFIARSLPNRFFTNFTFIKGIVMQI